MGRLSPISPIAHGLRWPRVVTPCCRSGLGEHRLAHRAPDCLVRSDRTLFSTYLKAQNRAGAANGPVGFDAYLKAQNRERHAGGATRLRHECETGRQRQGETRALAGGGTEAQGAPSADAKGPAKIRSPELSPIPQVLLRTRVELTYRMLMPFQLGKFIDLSA